MTTLLIQTALCLLAGVALWKMWRVVDRDERLVRFIVFVGFTSRAVAGTILFWISYLNLPILSRLQMGNGHWFFATDGRRYLREAIEIAQGGLPTIVTHHRTGASVSYVQTLATSTMLFGNAASVGVLINLFAYMGICLIIVKWRREVAAAGTPGLIALAAISLSPSAILWSTQPLKDTLFQFLIVAIIAAGALWQRAWRERPATGAIVTAALVMIAALFMAAGIRWYFGFVTLLASGMFFLLTAWNARAHWKAALAGVVTLFLMAQALVISASAYLPPYLQHLLAPWKPTRTVMAESLSTRVVSDLKEVRRGFENTGGATSIGVAGPLARIDEGRRIVPKAAPVTDDDFKRLQAKEAATATSPAPAPSHTTETAAPPAVTTQPPAAAATPPQVAAADPQQQTATAVTETGEPAPAPAVAEAPIVATTVTTADATPQQAADATPQHAAAATPKETPQQTTTPKKQTPKQTATTTSKSSTGTPKSGVASAPAPVPTPTPATVTAVQTPPAAVPAPVAAPAAAASEDIGDGAIVVPTSTFGRLVAGAVAVLLPSAVARKFGLIEMGGGRGFMWFTDIDTFVFDAMLIVAVWFIIRGVRRASFRNPVFWFVTLVAAVVVPLAYTVTNYGTLFRLRVMVYVAIALIPLALSMWTPDEDAAADAEPPAAEA